MRKEHLLLMINCIFIYTRKTSPALLIFKVKDLNIIILCCCLMSDTGLFILINLLIYTALKTKHFNDKYMIKCNKLSFYLPNWGIFWYINKNRCVT